MHYNIFLFRYNDLFAVGEQRRRKLEESCKAYQLVREAGELAQWISDKEAVALSDEVGGDLEQVQVVQRKFDDFQNVSYKLIYYLNDYENIYCFFIIASIFILYCLLCSLLY